MITDTLRRRVMDDQGILYLGTKDSEAIRKFREDIASGNWIITDAKPETK